MFDVCLGAPKAANAQVLVTVDDQGAAQRIEGALKKEADHFVQVEGQSVFVRPRKGPAPAAAEQTEPEPEQTEKAEPAAAPAKAAAAEKTAK